MADARETSRGPVQRAMVVIGVGTLVTAVIGVLVGAIAGDIPFWLGRIGTIGMAITAALGVLAAVVPSPQRRRR